MFRSKTKILQLTVTLTACAFLLIPTLMSVLAGVTVNYFSDFDIEDNIIENSIEDISNVSSDEIEERIVNHQKGNMLTNNLSFLDYFYGFLLLCVFLILLYLIFVE